MNEDEIKSRFELIEQRLEVLEGKGEIIKNESNAEKKKSLKEFLIEISPKNDVRRAAAIGYYLETHEGKEVFTAKEITEGFRKAKCKVPANVPDKIQKAISNGWFDNGTQKGTYSLTHTGERAVENKFAGSNDK